MILCLPRETRITMRTVTPMLRAAMQLVEHCWQGNRNEQEVPK